MNLTLLASSRPHQKYLCPIFLVQILQDYLTVIFSASSFAFSNQATSFFPSGQGRGLHGLHTGRCLSRPPSLQPARPVHAAPSSDGCRAPVS
jgi:hypothetical protein